MSAVGLDLSLTRTGVADQRGHVKTIRPGRLSGLERLDFIRHAVLDVIVHPDVELIIIEGYAYAAAHGAHQAGELGGIIRLTVWMANVPHYDIAPTTLKRYATGNGQANKEQVVANARERLGYGGFDNNEADALWLRAIGMDLLDEPVADLPRSYRAAIDNIRKTPPVHGAGLRATVDVPTGRLL